MALIEAVDDEEGDSGTIPNVAVVEGVGEAIDGVTVEDRDGA